ncbi:hypothetical protein ACRE_022010 [Hapsidospora chrysogenum ATCC 11550]|uniref:Uncharacterized protein n=1 Tax=Hapsidospora chrysogenum (strain ATCC 11550 / CBS 779.69 / DSM 880 / IAM 14645 / JCM 23072 / IMI 49137) TaxID=857340 RepID=A0A086TC05_HAPC1|nr:hypothetical protein ACRE_022010 [Hapsidospora chrysogenum ATCC 11550]
MSSFQGDLYSNLEHMPNNRGHLYSNPKLLPSNPECLSNGLRPLLSLKFRLASLWWSIRGPPSGLNHLPDRLFKMGRLHRPGTPTCRQFQTCLLRRI